MYFNNIYTDVEVIQDIRTQEVKKLLGLFHNDSIIYLDCYNNLYALHDFAVLSCVNLNMNNTSIINYDLAFKLYKYYDSEYYNKDNGDYLINDKNILFFMRNKILEYRNSIGELILSKSNLEEDPEFAELLNLKAGDPVKFYKVLDNNLEKTYAIPVFSRFPSLNKNDTIDITLNKDLTDSNKVIYTMNIYKKKFNRVVSKSCRLLNII